MSEFDPKDVGNDWAQPSAWGPVAVAAAGVIGLVLAAWAFATGQPKTALAFFIAGLLVIVAAPNLFRLNSVDLLKGRLKLDKLPQARALSPQKSQDLAAQFVAANAASSPSYVHAMHDVLSRQDKVDFLIIDLGSGKEWLTSRLFIIAALLSRTRGARTVVFLESRPDATDRYVGMADIQAVRWALAARYPLFEAAVISAFAYALRHCWPLVRSDWIDGTPVAESPQRILDTLAINQVTINSLTGALAPPETVGDVLYRYLAALRVNSPKEGVPPEGWIALRTGPGEGDYAYWEYGQWLNPAALRDLLGAALETSAIREGTNGVVRLADIVRWP